MLLGGIFDYDFKKERYEEVSRELESAELWQNPAAAQALTKERSTLEKVIQALDSLQNSIADNQVLLNLAIESQDQDTLEHLETDSQKLSAEVADLEFKRMFSGATDPNDAFLEIQSGSGGTEAQDWAEMLMRMYLRWCNAHGYETVILDKSDGDVAGIKGVSIKISGEYAFGRLKTETGVHRLVRKSPFDSGNRRHTSFAAVFISPVIDDSIEVDINPADLKIDTYRASGAGGQHVNRTDSAVRITHLPTNIVTQCQSDRSQHKNKAEAMSQLRAKLYELEMQKRNATKQALEDSKTDIGWGSQIRSYVLDDSRIKDLRTGVETTNTQGVLDGDLLDMFIEASLKAGIHQND